MLGYKVKCFKKTVWWLNTERMDYEQRIMTNLEFKQIMNSLPEAIVTSLVRYRCFTLFWLIGTIDYLEWLEFEMHTESKHKDISLINITADLNVTLFS